ncbi:PBSX family phage terminase large subunit [Aminobacterium colombiense]
MINRILTSKQIRSCQEATSRLNIWEGSVRSGKTYATMWKWFSWVPLEAPKTDTLLMIGKTTRTLERNILRPMSEMFGEDRFSYSLAKGQALLMGRVVDLVNANDERAQDKIRGSTVAGAYGDEITLWPESFFTMLLSRLSVKGAKFFGTTNPDSPFHWLKANYLDRQDLLNLSRWTFRLEDNTYLDPDYVAALKAEYTGLWYKRFILGQWCQAEGAVYDMWNESKHVIEKLPDLPYQRFIGIDYGTSNPTVFLDVAIHGEKVYAAHEYYWDSRAKGRQKTDSEYADDLLRFMQQLGLNTAPIIIDPSAASFIVELRKRNVNVLHADNSVVDGIRNVSSHLSSENLYVCQECVNLRKEFASYVWDEKSQAKGEDKPVKEHDHALDALRYVVQTERSRPRFGRLSKPRGF